MNQVPKRGTQPYVFRSAWMRLLMSIIDTLGRVLVWSGTLGRGLKIKDQAVSAPKRILVVRLDHIGDLLFTRPALQTLRRLYPEAHITLMLSSLSAELMRSDPSIDELLIWDAPWFSRTKGSKHTIGYWKIIKIIRGMKIDLSLDLRGDLRHHIMLTLAGVTCRFGHSITGGKFLLHQSVPLQPDVHEVERNLNVVRALKACETPRSYPPLVLDQQEISRGRQRWKSQQKRLVIHPTAGDKRKCWPKEFFVRFCHALIKQRCEIIFVGTASEQSRIHEIMEALEDRSMVQDLSGQTTLRELAAIISSADGLIGHDSGPAHIAVTQGVNTLMLWSNTNDPKEWGPWGDQAKTRVLKQHEQENALSLIMEMMRK